MDQLIRETHKKTNIDLLKIRDKHFSIARHINLIVIFCAFLPVVVSTISYVFMYIDWVDNYRDLYVGVLTFLMFILAHFFLKKVIDKHLSISNAFREEYDCRVFGIEHNKFAKKIGNLDFSKSADKLISSRRDLDKYECWYGEIQSSSNNSNILIAQLDNIIYTYCIYRSYRWLITVVRLSFVFVSLVLSFLFAHYNWRVLILTFVASFTIIQLLIEDFSVTTEMINKNKHLMDYLRDDDGLIRDIIDDDVKGKAFIRSVQDQIIDNRRNSIFVPFYIRKIYLTGKRKKNYYKILHGYRDIYFSNKKVTLPSSDIDIEVISQNEQTFTKLKIIHERLLQMFKKVKQAFDQEHVTYLLDGGSLIGACRESYNKNSNNINGGFIFWDDDIDLAIPFNQIEKAKQVIRKHCSNYLDVQDYNNDEYYSPRLSNFRIRERTSCVSEKDSELYRLYKYRGLFIDVYAYAPIYKNRLFDRVYRKLYLHPLHLRLEKIETKYPAILALDNKDVTRNYLSKFRRLKRIYLKRVDSYIKKSKNDAYYAYTPNYIENLKKPGPYLKKEWLNLREANFEGISTTVPSSFPLVLSAYYGPKWFKPPFYTTSQMVQNYKSRWYYSEINLGVTTMKHISTFDEK